MCVSVCVIHITLEQEFLKTLPQRYVLYKVVYQGGVVV